MFRKDQYLKEFMSIKQYFYNKKYETFQCKYGEIKQKYKETLKQKFEDDKKVEFIKLEKYRIENLIASIETNTNSALAALFVLTVTIIITIFSGLKVFDDIMKVSTLIIYIILILILSIGNFKDNVEVRIYNLAIKVLEDIEKEFIEVEDKIVATFYKQDSEDIKQILNDVENIKKFYGIS